MNSEPSPTASLDTLLAGIRRFRRDVYTPNRDRYEAAMKKPQTPHTLVVTCADSRIDPEALTQSGPGDIFVTRNIGNMVPAYGEMLGGVSAVIEYAVQALGVGQVVICGHTDCGAMKALLHPEAVSSMPTVKSWLRNGEAALSVVKSRSSAAAEPAELSQLIEQNVLLQMQHVRTHPSVAGRLARGNLAIYGWVYDIGNGHVNMYDPSADKFIPVEHDERGASLS